MAVKGRSTIGRVLLDSTLVDGMHVDLPFWEEGGDGRQATSRRARREVLAVALA